MEVAEHGDYRAWRLPSMETAEHGDCRACQLEALVAGEARRRGGSAAAPSPPLPMISVPISWMPLLWMMQTCRT